jgi:sensor histidine kinase regulating citrate/malate metabolism
MLRDAVFSREAMLGAMQEGIVLFDASGAVQYTNAASFHLLGRQIASTADLHPDALRDAVETVPEEGRT